ncbi:hypothetical protein FJTKL_02048 [Diaporthe vaccinii]|uniref:Uncharacterized protein n=1 Tax=Diaporthe vaccinii TaxID=105482 RepID=A0ABR4DZ36_9PEZI
MPARLVILPASWRNALHDHGPLRFQFKALKIPDTPVFPFVQYRHRTFFLRERRQYDRALGATKYTRVVQPPPLAKFL